MFSFVMFPLMCVNSCYIHSEVAISPLPSIPSLFNLNYHTWILYVALLLESIWKTWCMPSCSQLIRVLLCCVGVTYKNVHGILLWWIQSVSVGTVRVQLIHGNGGGKLFRYGKGKILQSCWCCIWWRECQLKHVF